MHCQRPPSAPQVGSSRTLPAALLASHISLKVSISHGGLHSSELIRIFIQHTHWQGHMLCGHWVAQMCEFSRQLRDEACEPL